MWKLHFGNEIDEIAKTYLGGPLWPWQRYAAEKITQHRRDQRDQIEWRHQEVVVTISRGQGKSFFLTALGLWRALSPEFGGPQEVVQVAQSVTAALSIWSPAMLQLQDLGVVERLRLGNNSPAAQLAGGSSWIVLPSKIKAVAGHRANFHLVDEVNAVDPSVWSQGLRYQWRQRRAVQAVFTSTASRDERPSVLTDRRELALRERGGNTLLLEWSAPPEAAVSDEVAWRYASPQWDRDTLKLLRHDFASTSNEQEFRTEAMNLATLAVDSWIPQSTWAELADPDLEVPRPGVVAVEVSREKRPRWFAVRAAMVGRVVHVESFVAEDPEGMWAWLDPEDRLFVAASLKDRPTGGVPVAGLVGVREVKRDLSSVRFRVMNGRVRHDGGGLLTSHLLRSQESRTQGGGLAYLHHGDELTRCLIWAVGKLIGDKPPVMV